MHGGIDATAVGTPKGNMDTINVWVAVGPTTTNGLVRTAKLLLLQSFVRKVMALTMEKQTE